MNDKYSPIHDSGTGGEEILTASSANALLLTGTPGAGKTTVVRRVAEKLSDARIRGFTTAEIRKGGERVGFRIETFEGESAVLAHVSIRSEYRVSRYGADVAVLERIVGRALALSPKADVYLVDEIGKMECLSDRFTEAVETLLDARRLLVATVALRGGGFIERVKRRPDIELWTVTRGNRETLPSDVIGWIARRRKRN
jgi:nucleoside-triphosphatase